MDDAADDRAEPTPDPPHPGTPLESADPRRIGSYEILSRLGVGGMGTVYLGRSADGGFVAIKLVHPHLAADREFRARFASEAHAGQRVPAFCSAKVLGSGTFEKRPYLVTEHIDGVPLSTFVAEHGPLDLPALHALALGTAAGIAAIHGVGLVHRDVKPSNIMMTFGGVRIIDFGIARALEETSGYTRTGIVMGSLGWAAPEQLEGASPSPAMDVFAWGCIIAYAATGKHPYGPGGLDTRANRILRDEPDLSGVPEPIRAFVSSALHHTAAARPTAQELLLALVGAGPPGPRRHLTGSLFRPHRTALALTGAIPLAIGLIMIIGAAGATELGDADGPMRVPSSGAVHGSREPNGSSAGNGRVPARENAQPDTGRSGDVASPAGSAGATGAGAGHTPATEPAPPTKSVTTAVPANSKSKDRTTKSK